MIQEQHDLLEKELAVEREIAQKREAQTEQRYEETDYAVDAYKVTPGFMGLPVKYFNRLLFSHKSQLQDGVRAAYSTREDQRGWKR